MRAKNGTNNEMIAIEQVRSQSNMNDVQHDPYEHEKQLLDEVPKHCRFGRIILIDATTIQRQCDLYFVPFVSMRENVLFFIIFVSMAKRARDRERICG